MTEVARALAPLGGLSHRINLSVGFNDGLGLTFPLVIDNRRVPEPEFAIGGRKNCRITVWISRRIRKFHPGRPFLMTFLKPVTNDPDIVRLPFTMTCIIRQNQVAVRTFSHTRSMVVNVLLTPKNSRVSDPRLVSCFDRLADQKYQK